MYPGWDLDRHFFAAAFTKTATINYAVAPDNIYETVLAEIAKASESIYYAGYNFKNAHLTKAIVDRMTANPGITVTVLLERAPVGGTEDQASGSASRSALSCHSEKARGNCHSSSR